MGGGNGQKSKMDRERKLEKMKSSKGSQLESNKKAMNIQMASEDRGGDQPSRMGPSGVRPDQTQDPHTSSSYSPAETTLFYPSQPPPSCYPAQPPPSYYPAQPSPSHYPAQPPPSHYPAQPPPSYYQAQPTPSYYPSQPPPYSGQPQYYPPLPTDYYPHPQPTYSTPPPPNTQAGPSTAPAAQIDTEGGTDSNTRIMIEPNGDTFCPSIHVTHHITNIIKSMFDGPYYSWKRIPLNVREIWFREFMRHFVWLPEHADCIRQNFERRCTYSLRDIFTDIRKTLQKPVWIGDDVWIRLLSKWGRPEYVQMREKNKRNRVSDYGSIGTSLHTRGSISYTEHRRRLKEALGKEPTMDELHQQAKDKQWVDQRSENVHSKYVRIREQTQASQGEGSSSQPSDFDTWREAAGGKKKRRIYGLGAVAYTGSSSSHSSYSMDSSRSTLETMIRRYEEQIREQNQHIREQNQYIMENNQHIKEQNQQIRELREEMTRQGEEYRREL